MHNSGDDQSFLVFIQSGFILQSFFLHSYFTFFSARFLTSLELNPPSELLFIYEAYQDFSILIVEETGLPGGNHLYMVRAENPFYTVQHIQCRELGSNPHPAQKAVTGLFRVRATPTPTKSEQLERGRQKDLT
jgi:hypothetical protein